MQRFAIVSLLLLNACIGSITGGDPDRPPVTPEDPPQPITSVKMLVRAGAKPQPGAKVIFQGSDGSVIADATTDLAGAASANMPSGGNLTVIRTFSPGINGEPAAPDEVYTYVGVKPGDVLEVVGGSHDATPYIANVTVGLTNGEFVGVMTPCGSGYGHAPTIQVQLTGCAGETDFYVVDYTGEVVDPEKGTLSGPQYFVAHASLTPTIDLSSEAFRGTLSIEIAASNMPMASVALQKRLLVDNFVVFDTGFVPSTLVTTDVPELPTTDQIVTAYVSYGAYGQLASSREGFTASRSTIDVATGLIPSSRVPGLAGNLLSWSEDGTGNADFSIASIVIDSVDRKFTRAVAAPYNGATMAIPPLPPAYDKYNVSSTDTPRLVHNLASMSGGWDAARARVFAVGLADLAPMGGRASVSFSSGAGTDDTKP